MINEFTVHLQDSIVCGNYHGTCHCQLQSASVKKRGLISTMTNNNNSNKNRKQQHSQQK